MPLFHFNMSGGLGPDEEGSELPDLAAARSAGLRLMAQSLLDHVEDFWAVPDQLLTVTDESGLALFAIHVIATDAPAVQITLRPIQPS